MVVLVPVLLLFVHGVEVAVPGVVAVPPCCCCPPGRGVVDTGAFMVPAVPVVPVVVPVVDVVPVVFCWPVGVPLTVPVVAGAPGVVVAGVPAPTAAPPVAAPPAVCAIAKLEASANAEISSTRILVLPIDKSRPRLRYHGLRCGGCGSSGFDGLNAAPVGGPTCD